MFDFPLTHVCCGVFCVPSLLNAFCPVSLALLTIHSSLLSGVDTTYVDIFACTNEIFTNLRIWTISWELTCEFLGLLDSNGYNKVIFAWYIFLRIFQKKVNYAEI